MTEKTNIWLKISGIPMTIPRRSWFMIVIRFRGRNGSYKSRAIRCDSGSISWM